MKSDSQKYMGKNQLLKRLASQVGSTKMAVAILVKRGDMTSGGKLTKKGEKRDDMTAEERAIDRYSKQLGRDKKDFSYNPVTNRAKLKDNRNK